MLNINPSEFLKRFKVYESPLLFDIDQKEMFATLKQNRCLICGNKLKFMRNGKMAFCKSVKHKKSFIISVEKLNKINGK